MAYFRRRRVPSAHRRRAIYKTVPSVVTDAMKQLEARIARAADVQQLSVN